MVEPVDVVPAEGAVQLDLDVGLAHATEVVAADPLGAHPVDQDVGADAGAGALGERLGKLPRHVGRPVDVGLERDGAPGGPDRGEHRGKHLVAIDQRRHAIAGHEARAQQAAHAADELRVARSVDVRQGALDLPLGAEQVRAEEDDDDGGRRDGGHLSRAHLSQTLRPSRWPPCRPLRIH